MSVQASSAASSAAAPLTIAIDAMGGDHGPEEVVKAAAALSVENRAGERPLHLLLVGDAPRLSALLYELRHDAERISIHHAREAVGMDESPRVALDSKPDASIAVAARLCAEGLADALVSAGNTGASVLACQRYFRRLQGVRRCALAAVYPTEMRRGEKDDPFSMLLDVGATLDVTADDLCTFAVMGAGYASRISKNARPKVALLSNGAEAGKGVLKMLEGVSETVVRLASYAYKEKLMWRAGLAMLSGGIGRLKELTDWKQYGGAPLLGFDRVMIKAHGRSHAHALQNAVKVAAKTVATGMVQEIERALREIPQGEAPATPPVSGQ